VLTSCLIAVQVPAVANARGPKWRSDSKRRATAAPAADADIDLAERSRFEARFLPEPIAGPGKAGAETHTARDRDRPRGGGDQLGHPETKQMRRSAHRDQDAGTEGSVAVLIMATPNKT
jgi:hypothetical protein